ncbi:MAG: hypothetical protein K0S14_952 [Thermomicrobiales bacterium]|nr:hypothetical protein [Thermomicrobiales bacterium]
MKPADATRRDPVDILTGCDRRNHIQHMNVRRQRQEHDNAVNVVSFIQPFDRLDHAAGGRCYRQQDVHVNDAASAHGLRDSIAIGGGRWCTPSENGRQRR